MRDDQCIHYTHEIPIFGVTLHVLRANQYARAWNALFTSIPAEPNRFAYGSSWFEKETMTAYIGLRTDANCQTIAHEALHITHAILSNIGHEADYENDEVECYLLGYIVLQATPDKAEKKIKYPTCSTR